MAGGREVRRWAPAPSALAPTPCATPAGRVLRPQSLCPQGHGHPLGKSPARYTVALKVIQEKTVL